MAERAALGSGLDGELANLHLTDRGREGQIVTLTQPPFHLLTNSWFLRRYLLWIVCGAGHARRPSAVRIRGQHPPLAGSVSAGPHAPPQRPALPAGHAGVRVDTHAPPL